MTKLLNIALSSQDFYHVNRKIVQSCSKNGSAVLQFCGSEVLQSCRLAVNFQTSNLKPQTSNSQTHNSSFIIRISISSSGNKILFLALE